MIYFIPSLIQPKRSKRNVIYVAAGLISVFVIVYASIALVHGYDAKSAEAGVETVLPLHSSPVSTSETSLKSGAVTYACPFFELFDGYVKQFSTFTICRCTSKLTNGST